MNLQFNTTAKKCCCVDPSDTYNREYLRHIKHLIIDFVWIFILNYQQLSLT
jgi:hypothetical protein